MKAQLPQHARTPEFKAMIEDKNISFGAKGLLSHVLGTTGTKFNLNQLACASNDEKEATYSAIKELVDAGYIERVKNNSKDGFYVGLEYSVNLPPKTPPFTPEVV